MTNKTVKVDNSKVLESLCSELELHFQTKKEADGEIKAIKEQIVDIINKNKKKYFDGKKSFVIGSIVIALKTDNKYTVNEDFDLAKFWKKYPDAVKIELAHSGMKNVTLKDWEISLDSKEKVDITAKPTK